jgi:uncharacterized protein YdgA (DUF945 family)
MKKIIAVVVVLILLASAAPFVNGLLMEKTVHRAFENANTIYAESNTGYSLEILRYERNFRSSEIEWKINFGSMKAFYGIEEMIFVDNAKHGYTGVVSTTSLESNPWFQNIINNKLQGSNPFNISTTYSLFGEIVTTMSFDAFSVVVDDETLEIDSGNFIISTDTEMKKYTTSANWQGMHVDDKAKLSKITMTADMEMISTFLWDGNFQFAIDSLVIDEDHHHVEWADFTAQYSSKIDSVKNQLSTESSFSLKSLNTGNMNVDGASATFALRNMDAQGYEEFMDFYTRTVYDALAKSAELEADPQASQDMLKEQLGNVGIQAIAAFEKLLQAGLEMEISDVIIKLSEGDINGSLNISLLKDMTLMQFAPVVGQPELILDILYLKSDVDLPATFAENAPNLTAPIFPGMQGGLFVEDGDYLRHRAETIDGKLMLNGNEVNLSR